MNDEELAHALRTNRIATHEWQLLTEFLRNTEASSRPGSAVRDVVRRLVVEPCEAPSTACPGVGKIPSNVPRAEDRPGLCELFLEAHRDAITDVHDADELARCETLAQVQALVRDRTQSVFARSIRDVARAMEPWLNAEQFVIPVADRGLRTPDAAEQTSEGGVPLAVLPWPSFAAMFSLDHVDPLLAILRRTVERMGRHFADQWRKAHAAEPQTLDAVELLAGLRRLSFTQTLANGFASGVADVINPLHILVVKVLERDGPGSLTLERQAQITARHEDFSVFLATFSLSCVAGLEHTLRVPASPETLHIVANWTRFFPDFRGKGYPLDCNYDPRYFTLREASGVPILDLDIHAFTPAEQQEISNRTVRLGCPSQGYAHRMFTRAMCRAYFTIVLPVLLRSRESAVP